MVLQLLHSNLPPREVLHVLDTILVHCILHVLGTILVHCLIWALCLYIVIKDNCVVGSFCVLTFKVRELFVILLLPTLTVCVQLQPK